MVMGRRTARGTLGAWIGALILAPALAAAEPARIPEPVNTGREWKVYKTAWSAQDEAGYAAFVQAIGRSDCASLEACLKDEANPYRHTDKRAFRGDCADMAYMLRAYYAWKNGLPFSYQKAMRTADGSPQDLRYSTSGNVVAARRQVINHTSDAPHFIQRIAREVSTAMFRTHPVTGGGAHFDDFYPVKIDREAVRPGVIAYDIFGHVGIVYDVLEDGRILVVASHPDNSVTRSVYGPNFLRAKPALGAGLKAWRPVRVEGARRLKDGALQGGELRAAPNEAIPDFSLEQFYGNVPHPSGEWHYGEFRHQGRTLRYYDYVRRKLAAPGFAYDPVTELRHGLQAICSAIKDRKTAVDRAVEARIHLRPHPDRLPPNIYGTYGLWEDYSTPSRDARLKVSFIELRRETQRLYEAAQTGDPAVRYEGGDLARALWDAFNEEKDRCTIIYRRSDDTRVMLNLGHVMDRLWDLSFDPYHCPERRWGAAGAELETCTDDAEKTRWYNAQRFLRYQAERTYDARMDFALHELKPPMTAPPEEGGLGVDAPADADLRAFLALINDIRTAEVEASPAPAAAGGPREAR
ncbi:MAG: hypothetical protein Kow00133_09360 [Amphiplicatus sp.]